MIFVTVGTSTFPFERLLRQIDRLRVVEEAVVVQYGSSSFVPRASVAQRFMDYEEVARRMQEARVVIAHAGAGSILTAFHLGVRPVVVPRRKELGEVVDDHQVELARRLARAGLVTLVDDVEALTAARLQAVHPHRAAAARSSLVEEVAAFVDAAVAARGR